MINICLVACPTNCPNISPSSCVWVHFQYFYLDCMKLSMTVVYPSRQKWTIAESKTENLPPLDFCINPIKSGSTDQQLWSSFISFIPFCVKKAIFWGHILILSVWFLYESGEGQKQMFTNQICYPILTDWNIGSLKILFHTSFKIDVFRLWMLILQGY